MVEHLNETNDPHPQHEPRPGDDFPADLFDEATEAPGGGPPPEPTPSPAGDADTTPVADTKAATSEPPEPIPPTPPPTPSLGDASPKPPIFPVVMGLVLVGVLAGAVAFNRKVSQEGANAATTSSAPAPAPAEPEKPAPATPLTDDVKALQTEMAGLATQVKGLQEKIDALPKPEPPPDLKPLQSRIAELAQSSESVGPLSKKVGDLDERVGAVDKSLGALKEEVASLRDEVKKASEQAAAAVASASKPATNSPRETAAALTNPSALDEGVKLFKAGKFKEADDLFLKMTETDPNDARVWYFAALSNGFATGKWDGKTAELVQKGIEREKAGSPGASEIDAAFRDLTPATGKDWLAGYRQRARSR
jgi:TolA-binding protein